MRLSFLLRESTADKGLDKRSLDIRNGPSRSAKVEMSLVLCEQLKDTVQVLLETVLDVDLLALVAGEGETEVGEKTVVVAGKKHEEETGKSETASHPSSMNH